MAEPTPSEPGINLQQLLRHWYWMPLAVLALGLGSIIMLFSSNWIRESLMAKDIQLVGAVGEIQTLTAISHLWIEEYVTGDEVDLEEIEGHLRRSVQLMSGVLRPEDLANRQLLMTASEEVDLQALVDRINGRLMEFSELTDRRRRGFERGEEVGIGSPFDVEYDSVFNSLLEDLRLLEDHLNRHLVLAENRSRLLFRSMLSAWVLIVVLAVTGLWTRERRRMLAEDALVESQAQLLQAQKMEAVGRLAGGMAHDINNHLAAITAQCELVQLKTEPDSPVARKMEAVLSTASKSSTLIKRLLAFSRRDPASPQVLNLNGIIEGMERMLTRLIGEDIRLETRLQPDLWNVTIDPSQLEQVLLNLVINGREAMPTGGLLRVETANLAGEAPTKDAEPSGDQVQLVVADSGAGIAPEIHDRIFEPFFTTKEASGNSGLGLATVHGIVQQNRGAISLSSELGQGAVFTVRFPRTLKAATGEAGETREVAPRAGGSERILLVEDNEELRRSVCEMLVALGYSVWAAASAEEALRSYASEVGNVDLVITDVVMPGMSGRQLADRLQQDDPGIKTLFVSGHTDDMILRHGIKEGEVDFLSKPFTSETLARKIRQILLAGSEEQTPART